MVLGLCLMTVMDRVVGVQAEEGRWWEVGC